MNQAKFPISDQDMHVLLQKYPFLRYRSVITGKQCYQGKSKNVKYNLYKIFDGHGWENLWKNKYLPRLFAEYDSMSNNEKKMFFIRDVKSKFGTLRIEQTFKRSYVNEWVAEFISRYTCEICGQEPICNGHRQIWVTKGWVRHLCKDCARKYLESQSEVMCIDKTLDSMEETMTSDDCEYDGAAFRETPDGWLLEIK